MSDTGKQDVMFHVAVQPHSASFRPVFMEQPDGNEVRYQRIIDYPPYIRHAQIMVYGLSEDPSEPYVDCAFANVLIFNDLHPAEGVVRFLESTGNPVKRSAILRLVSSTAYINHNPGETWSGILESLYVYPLYRKKGMAELILNGMNDFIKGCFYGTRLNCLLAPLYPMGYVEIPDETSADNVRIVYMGSGFKRLPGAYSVEDELWVKNYESRLRLAL